MKRYTKKNRVPTMFFVVAGIMVLGITGFMLSDAGKKFYEPESRSTSCPPAGYNCLNTTTQRSASVDSQCLIQGSPTIYYYCCSQPKTYAINFSTGSVSCVSSTPTATPTATSACPAGYQCELQNECDGIKGDSCGNIRVCCKPTQTPTPNPTTACPADYYCISSQTCDADVISIGSTKGASCGTGKSCCKPPSGSTPPPGGTTVPTTPPGGGGGGGGGGTNTAQCVVYGLNYPATMCTNPTCPVGVSLCQEKDFATATHTKCVLPSTAGKVRLYSCCAANQRLQNGACVTVATKPEVVTKSPASNVTKTGAKITGEVTADGGSTITERGFVYSASNTAPVLGGGNSKKTVAGKVGEYSATLTGLTNLKKYYFRAYAKNAKGTSYGAVRSFKTLGDQIVAPEVETHAASSISQTGATLNGEVISDGGSAITERGFVYSKTEATPTIANATKQAATGTTGEFAAALSGLSNNTVYYYRAFAINAKGTSYGAVVDFRTGTSGTPSVSHTPEDTGFADEPLLYIGAVLYGIGVVSFVAARYFGIARRKL